VAASLPWFDKVTDLSFLDPLGDEGRAKQYAGPLMTEALRLYEEERRYCWLQEMGGTSDKLKTIGYTQELLEAHGLDKVTLEHGFYRSTHLKRRAVRQYGNAIREVWKYFPKEKKRWQLPDFLLAHSTRMTLVSVTTGSSQPHEFFSRWLSNFNAHVTRFNQYQYDEYLEAQRRKSTQGTAARWSERDSVNAILAKLAKQCDVLGDPAPAKELWPGFYSALEAEGLSPTETGDRITWYGNDKGMTLKTFTNRLSKARNK
jgi:hypothetical protein